MRRPDLLLLLLPLAGCQAGRRTMAASNVTLVFAADQLGYLSPCGCSEHQLGGAARAAAFVEQTSQATPTLFIEGGNLLFSALQLSVEERDQLQAKALALARSWERATAGASRSFRFGPYDLSLGAQFAQQALSVGPPLEGGRIVEVAGSKIGLLPISKEPAPSRLGSEELRKQGAEVVIAVVQAPRLAEAAELAAAAGADLALQAGVVDPVSDTEEAVMLGGRVPAFRVKDKGRGLLKMTLHLRPAASVPGLAVPESADLRQGRAADLEKVLASDKERLAVATGSLRDLLELKVHDLTARRDELLKPQATPSDRSWADFTFVVLDDQKPEDAAVKAIFDEYTVDIGRKNLAAQKNKVCPAPAPGQPHYVGVDSCRDCHPDPAAVYEATQHRSAYQTLVDKSRQYDIECIRCHVVGYDQPGGVCRLDQVGHLAGVQCESCHGMGSAHVDSAGDVTKIPVPKPGIETCLRCHTPDNDTRFSPEQFASHYLPAILGPGHGLPRRASGAVK
jgi:hypothetical protein